MAPLHPFWYSLLWAPSPTSASTPTLPFGFFCMCTSQILPETSLLGPKQTHGPGGPWGKWGLPTATVPCAFPSHTVMACPKMHGLRQRTRTSRFVSFLTLCSGCQSPMRGKLPWLISSISHFTWRGLVAFSRVLNWIRDKPTKRLQTYQEFTLRDCHILDARYSILFSLYTLLGDHIK